ncbi:heme oxygenase-like protein [Dothidotthia symphoricarpi CBS 119687]|uniref:Heme oxygenase-like protein n=1 Tax=Dothidotthia symphoricarpi CBS 119687 TaxID=1392245 RepID=A0A6A6AA43_9PLEO|nr:heme oxygenase-like protein [Dothidotthia symphoricarpi CBS 119687]KAF2128426.1 heme oxygenase-like protein [Dothidotthia symphoricarpi CBS 119687]
MAHHPGTAVNALGLDLNDVPHALTTHLMSYNSDHFRRATQSSFLVHAAKGTLPKPVLAQWLANDRVYLQGYVSYAEQLLSLLRRIMPRELVKGHKSVEHRLVDWLEEALQNIRREENFFVEIADTYKLNVSWITSTANASTKSEGLRRFETLFAQTGRNQEHTFIPWLEGAVLLWATEKVFYEAFSWAQKQDTQASSRMYENDQDGGAMRKDLIPNWSNRDFLMLVETLERIINEGVGSAVNKDDARWKEVKTRTHAVWEALLDAEEAFWPSVGTSTAVNSNAGYASTSTHSHVGHNSTATDSCAGHTSTGVGGNVGQKSTPVDSSAHNTLSAVHGNAANKSTVTSGDVGHTKEFDGLWLKSTEQWNGGDYLGQGRPWVPHVDCNCCQNTPHLR